MLLRRTVPSEDGTRERQTCVDGITHALLVTHATLITFRRCRTGHTPSVCLPNEARSRADYRHFQRRGILNRMTPATPKKPAPKPKKAALPGRAARPASPAPKPAPAPAAKKLKILIIDDDAFISGMYATRLTNDGYQVVTALDGALGIAAAAKEKPDVILCDVLMPNLDGFETLKRLKEDPALKAIPVMMLTSMGQKEDVARGLEMGAADYMVKTNTLPIDASDKIKKLLKKPEAR